MNFSLILYYLLKHYSELPSQSLYAEKIHQDLQESITGRTLELLLRFYIEASKKSTNNKYHNS